MNRTNTV